MALAEEFLGKTHQRVRRDDFPFGPQLAANAQGRWQPGFQMEITGSLFSGRGYQRIQIHMLV